MVSPATDALTEEWERVRRWPDEDRRELVSRLLRSLQQSPSAAPSAAPSDVAPAQLIGAWADGSPPTDEEVAQILEDERLRKHG